MTKSVAAFPQSFDAVKLLLGALTVIGFATQSAKYLPLISSNPRELVPVACLVALTTLMLVLIALAISPGGVSREPGQKTLWITALFLSAVVTPWLALKGNGAFATLLESRLSRQFIQDWEPALVGPIVEEILKGVVVFALIVVFRQRVTRPVHAFFVGIFVGIGFQFTENLGYALNSAFESLVSDATGGTETALLRAGFGISTHWIYTAIFALGVGYLMGISYQCVTVCSQKAWHLRRFLTGVGLMLVSIALHFLWNSPLEFGFGSAALIVKALIPVAVFVLAIWGIRRAEKDTESAKKPAIVEPGDRETELVHGHPEGEEPSSTCFEGTHLNSK